MTTVLVRRLRPGAAGGPRAGLREALASEWTKIRTVRSTVWTLVVMAALTIAFAVFVGLTESLQPDDTVLGGSLTGAVSGLIAAGVFGVLAISGEYGTGLIRATLTACPRRVTVLAAKTAVVAASVVACALPACSIAYWIGRVALSGQGYAPGEPLPALLGVALCVAVVGVLGLAVGTILRHAAGAITAILGVILLPSLFGPLLGDWQRWAVGASPLTALQKLAQSSDAAPEVAGGLGAWPSLGLVCGYTGAILALSAWLFSRRDA
jgi:ABC-2 type transport system permease protein